MRAEAALERLMAGNARFVSGSVRAPRRDAVRRVEVANEQRPFAAILACADSRVPPEIVFDEGLGDLFVVRVAGNTAVDPLVVGSLQYAVEVLGTPLVFVLGHSQCGAVKAAIDLVDTGNVPPGDLRSVVSPIVPAVEAVARTPEAERLDAAIEENVHRAIVRLRGDELLAPRVARGSILVTGGIYQLESGQVELIERHCP